MPTSAFTVRALPQRLGEQSLGRHVEHDPRSRRYAYQAAAPTIVTTIHQRHVAVWDQGELGSCTGNAMAGVLGTDPFIATLPPSVTLNEQYAVTLYSQATTLDTIAGSYPPADTGSTGLAVAKAAQAKGLISGYQHTFSAQDALLALVQTPILIGTNWYSSMDNPNSDGVVSISASAQILGGHEYAVHGVDVEKQLVWATNSWGTSWGKQGTFAMTFATFARLLSEDGDVIVPTPLTAPAPQPSPAPAPVAPAPTPVPAVSAADQALNAALKSAEAAYATWRKAKGIS